MLLWQGEQEDSKSPIVGVLDSMRQDLMHGFGGQAELEEAGVGGYSSTGGRGIELE